MILIEGNKNALKEQVNLDLYNNIMIFIKKHFKDNTVEIDTDILTLENWKESDEFIQKYDSIDKLINEYKDINILTIQDQRAVILSVVNSNILETDILSSEFKEKFVKDICYLNKQKFDIYIISSLMKITNDKDLHCRLFRDILETKYENISDIIFILSEVNNIETAKYIFEQLKEQLIKLFGIKHNFSIEGNEGLLKDLLIFINKYELLKKGKNLEFFKALNSLSKRRIKVEDSYFKILIKNGYKGTEIMYLNYILPVLCNSMKLKTNSYFEIILNFCIYCLSDKETLNPYVYELLEKTLSEYNYLFKKYKGKDKILNVIEPYVKFKNFDTFNWFINLSGYLQFNDYSEVWILDILNDDCCEIYAKLDKAYSIKMIDKYILNLIRKNKIENRKIFEEIINKFNEVTNLSYLDSFEIFDLPRPQDIFNQLIEFNFIKITNYISSDILNKSLKSLIGNYIHGIETIEKFNLMKSFYDKYGAMDYFKNFDENFGHGFFKNFHSTKSRQFCLSEKQLDFMNDSHIQIVIEWVNNWMFFTRPKEYIQFILQILSDDTINKYYKKENLRKLYDLLPEDI